MRIGDPFRAVLLSGALIVGCDAPKGSPSAIAPKDTQRTDGPSADGSVGGEADDTSDAAREESLDDGLDGASKNAIDTGWPECDASLARIRLLASFPAPLDEHVSIADDGTTLYVGTTSKTTGKPMVWSVSKETGAVGELWTGAGVDLAAQQAGMEGLSNLTLDGPRSMQRPDSLFAGCPKAGGPSRRW